MNLLTGEIVASRDIHDLLISFGRSAEPDGTALSFAMDAAGEPSEWCRRQVHRAWRSSGLRTVPHGPLNGNADLWPTELDAFGLCTIDTSPDALLDYAALKFSAGTADLKHQLAGRRGGVDIRLVQEQIDADSFEVLDCAKQIDERAAEPIDGPSHHDVEFPAGSILQHEIEAGTVLAPLRTRDAIVGVDVDDIPTTTLGDLPKLTFLIFCRLLGRPGHSPLRPAVASIYAQ